MIKLIRILDTLTNVTQVSRVFAMLLIQYLNVIVYFHFSTTVGTDTSVEPAGKLTTSLGKLEVGC